VIFHCLYIIDHVGAVVLLAESGGQLAEGLEKYPDLAVIL
jgi:hypothetical protein